MLDPDQEALREQIVELMGNLNAANYRLLMLIGEMDANYDLGIGVRSMAHWLNWQCGISLTAAREKVRVARALPSLPLTCEAFRKGELSYSKVRALTRVATPHIEEYLLNIARHGTASHLDSVVRGYRQATRRERLAQREARTLTHYFDDDGMLVVRGRFTPEDGAVVVAALEQAVAALKAQEQPAPDAPASAADAPAPAADGDELPGEDEARLERVEYAPAGVCTEATELPFNPWGAEQADAMALLARSFLAHGPPERLRGEPHEIILHMSVEALAGKGLTFFAKGPGFGAEDARRLSCDAAIVPLIEDAGGEPLGVGRRRRTVPTGIRRALEARDRSSCRFPGCTQRRHLHAHHIEHWADGGETALGNLALLCSFHHRLVHDGCVSVEHDGPGLRFRHQATGTDLDPAPPPSYAEVSAETLTELLARHGIEVTPDAAQCHWQGERFDRHEAVGGLCECEAMGQAVREHPAHAGA